MIYVWERYIYFSCQGLYTHTYISLSAVVIIQFCLNIFSGRTLFKNFFDLSLVGLINQWTFTSILGKKKHAWHMGCTLPAALASERWCPWLLHLSPLRTPVIPNPGIHFLPLFLHLISSIFTVNFQLKGREKFIFYIYLIYILYIFNICYYLFKYICIYM